MTETTFSQFCKDRDAVVVEHTGMSSYCWPDLVFFHDHWAEGMTPEQSAAILMDEVARDMGICINDIAPGLAEYV